MKNFYSLIALCFIGQFLFADPPDPPIGYRWVINTQFSDEFNGNSLDKTKWNDTFGDWEGRPPALFIPEAITLKNGNLEIKSGILDKPYKNYTIFGGAVSSNTYDAHFGYYECRAKASKIAMSTTFWMSNQEIPFTHSNCSTDSYSQELDIQEAIGGGTTEEKFRNGMNSNTHFRYIRCGATKEEFISKGTGTKLHSEVSSDFHIYGAWWLNANEVRFYANDQVFDTVMVRTDISKKPFDRPMKINMVTETYNWQPLPSHEDLVNDKINTAYYDWVRSYILLPINEEYSRNEYFDIYKNEIKIVEIGHSKKQVLIGFTYKSNEDKEIIVSLKSGNQIIQTQSIEVLAGFGNNQKTFDLSFIPESNTIYELELTFSSSAISVAEEFSFQ